MDGIVIQLDPRADPQIGISFPQPIDFIKINSSVVTIVIGESNILYPSSPRRIRPGLEQFLRVLLHTMSLRVHVVVGKELIVYS